MTQAAAVGGDTVIRVEGLRKTYGDLAAVDGISFEVHKGEVFGLLGPNGAGKTTTVEVLEGLRKPDGGTVSVLGIDVVSDPEPAEAPDRRLAAERRALPEAHGRRAPRPVRGRSIRSRARATS